MRQTLAVLSSWRIGRVTVWCGLDDIATVVSGSRISRRPKNNCRTSPPPACMFLLTFASTECNASHLFLIPTLPLERRRALTVKARERIHSSGRARVRKCVRERTDVRVASLQGQETVWQRRAWPQRSTNGRGNVHRQVSGAAHAHACVTSDDWIGCTR